ncbi:MAG: hypothetical protein J0J01_05775 [Reyranella sp.]|uniref:hypothetical protein n=1 Tax=Reyranella sp. TaxID=1929291 RepID=UPI001AC28F76|nr:hypothetical protein [Reyranella sp.]MBN9086397.1 hypothetical protein [Reyranella sp.]
MSVWTAAAVAAWEIVRLIARWDYKDGRPYWRYVFSDLNAVIYVFVAVASLAAGMLAFHATGRVRPAARVALLAVLAPAALLCAAALTVTLGTLLQAHENGGLIDPLALLSVFGGALAIAAHKLGLPSVLAAAAWSWFFCLR